MNILLVSPRTPDTFWSFKHALPFVSKRAAQPPLGLLTVAAFLPGEWNLRLVDLDTSRLRDAAIRWADWVFVGGMIVHEPSVREIAARCAALGKPVLAGGPLFTTGHERFPEIAHFVLGEAEELMPQVVADLAAGRVQRVYRAPRFPSWPARRRRAGTCCACATTPACRCSSRAAAPTTASSATSSS